MSSDSNNSTGRKPIGRDSFMFLCDPEVECFNRCCRNPDLELYPYDVARLCTRLGLNSREFLNSHTFHASRSNPYFPSVMLKMENDGSGTCPFMSPEGCSVYEDRPDACRMFPLERGVSVDPLQKRKSEEIYYMQKLPYCLGHDRAAEWTAASWVHSQGLSEYNRMGDLWAELSLLFRRNPWGPEGAHSRNFRMAYMACYDLDNFRAFVFGSSFLKRYRLRPEWLERIQQDNAALLEFGFDWLKYFLFNLQPDKFTPAGMPPVSRP